MEKWIFWLKTVPSCFTGNYTDLGRTCLWKYRRWKRIQQKQRYGKVEIMTLHNLGHFSQCPNLVLLSMTRRSCSTCSFSINLDSSWGQRGLVCPYSFPAGHPYAHPGLWIVLGVTCCSKARLSQWDSVTSSTQSLPPSSIFSLYWNSWGQLFLYDLYE